MVKFNQHMTQDSYVQLSKWWRGKSAQAAFRRVAKQKKERIKQMKVRLAQKRKELNAE